MLSRERIVVAEVTRGLALGGAERGLLTRLAAADHERFDYRVINALPESSELRDELLAAGVTVRDVPGRSELQRSIELVRMLHEMRPHVINVHSPSVAAVLKLLRPFIATRALIETVHNVSYRRWSVRQAARLTRNLVDGSIVVADGVAKGPFAPTKRDRSETIHLGVDVNRIAGARATQRQRWRQLLEIPQGSCVVALVAAFRPQKNHRMLVEMVAQHEEVFRTLGAVFVLAGDGPLRPAIRRMIRELDIGDLFRLPGAVEHGWQLAAAADIALLTSHHEGLPVFFMEAMAAGVPVVSSDVGAVDEIVRDQENGLLYAAGDSAALARALCRLMTEADLWRRLGDGARMTAGAWSADTSARRHEIHYVQMAQASAL